MDRHELYLHEELLLLALRDREGTLPAAASQLPFALGGALLAELMLRERARVTTVKKRELVEVVDATRVGEPVLDDCLERIRSAKRRATLEAWVGRSANMKGLKHRVARGLCASGVLRHAEDKVLLLFKRKIYPEIDPRPERQLVERLDQAIFGPGRDVEARTAVLLSLAQASGLLKLAFPAAELKRCKARIATLVEGEPTGAATKKAIEAVQAAMIAVAIAAGVAAS